MKGLWTALVIVVLIGTAAVGASPEDNDPEKDLAVLRAENTLLKKTVERQKEEIDVLRKELAGLKAPQRKESKAFLPDQKIRNGLSAEKFIIEAGEGFWTLSGQIVNDYKRLLTAAQCQDVRSGDDRGCSRGGHAREAGWGKTQLRQAHLCALVRGQRHDELRFWRLVPCQRQAGRRSVA